MTSAPLAGRVYVPRLYRTSGKATLTSFVHGAVVASGGSVVYSSAWDSPNVAPLYLGLELGHGERYGVLCYPFRQNHRRINRRPENEHRLQIRYGSEKTWGEDHSIGHDVAGVDVTIVLGVDPELGVFVGLDPLAYDPLPMGISVESKDENVRDAITNGWASWERINRAGRRREKARTTEGLEAVVAFRPDRFGDFLRFEREASALGLDPPLRLALARRPFLGGGAAQVRHALEEEFDLDAAEILDIIRNRFRLGVAVKGGVAEHHLERRLCDDPDVASVRQIDEDGRPDFEVELINGPRVLVECKNVSPNPYADGTPKVEVQKTRSQRGDPAGRLYRYDQFDVVAACMFSITGSWEFLYRRASQLEPHAVYKDRIAPVQRVEGWARTLAQALDEQ